MSNFNVNKNRDASATINGFVYQVNETIDKWITLNNNEYLELEKGEDIDIIQKEIISNNNTIIEKEKRVLEQIKHRKSTIRLTSPEFIEALINFKEHSEKNSSTNLKLVYFTNSSIGKEQTSPLKNKKGVDVWNSIQNKEFHGFEEKNLIAGIKSLIIRNKPFSQIDQIQKWEKWKLYITNSSTEELKILISKVKINHSNIASNKFSNEIIEKLTIIVSDKNSAEILYYKLFSFVFEILSKKGEKILSKDGFEKIKTESDILRTNKSINKIKVFLQNNFSEVTEKLDIIKDELSQTKKGVNDIKSLLYNTKESYVLKEKLLITDLKVAISFDDEDIIFVQKLTNLLISHKISIYSNNEKLNEYIDDKSYFIKVTDIQQIVDINYCFVILSEGFHKNQWNKNTYCEILKFSNDNSKQILSIKLGNNIQNVIGVTSFFTSLIAKSHEIEKVVETLFKIINKSQIDNTRIEKEINIESILKIYSSGNIIEGFPERIDDKFGYQVYLIKDEHDLRPAQHFLHIYRKSQLENIYKDFTQNYKGLSLSKDFTILMPKELNQKKHEIRLSRFIATFGIKNAFYIDDFIWKISKIKISIPEKIINYVEPNLVNTYHLSTLSLFKNWLNSENNSTLFLTGIGGIGKTYLANKISEIFCKNNPNSTVIFIKSEEVVQWLKSKESLNISVDLYEFYKAYYEINTDEYKIPLEKFQVNLDNGNILLIIDGLEEISNRLENFNIKSFLFSINEYANELKRRKVLITSRVNYKKFSSDEMFFETIEIEHFDLPLVRKYFSNYFKNDIPKIEYGIKVAKELMKNEEKFLPFVLDIIQNIISDNNIIQTTSLQSEILSSKINDDYIILNVFDREVIKTEQKLTIDQQVNLFIEIATKLDGYTINDLKLSLGEITSKNDIDFIIQKLLVHPLLKINIDKITFRYDFLYDHFKNIYLGEFLKKKIELNDILCQILSEKIKYNQSATYDIAKRIGNFDFETISYLIDIIAKINSKIKNKEKRRKAISGIFTIALQVQHKIKSNDKRTNRELLIDMFGEKPVKDLSMINFSNINGCKIVFDFSNLIFDDCYFYAYENFWECNFENAYFNGNCEFHYLHKDKQVKITNISQTKNFHSDCFIDSITKNVFAEKEDNSKANFEKAKNDLRGFCKIFHNRHMVNRPENYIRSKRPYSSKFIKILEGELIERHPLIKTEYKIIDEYKEEIRKYCESGNPITKNILRFIELIRV